MDEDCRVLVDCRRALADGTVVELRLRAADGQPLAPWMPGAHIDVVLPSGLIRPYSLCGDPAEPSYTIAVQRETASRGGSAEIHDRIEVGDTLVIRGPRNHFPLLPAGHHVFIAGGIGITPLLAMARMTSLAGGSWELHFGGRTRSQMAYLGETAGLAGGAVTTYPQDEVGLIPVADILQRVPGCSSIYTCGPEPLLAAVEDLAATAGLPVHLERFGPAGSPSTTADVNTQFLVTLHRSARTLTVPADRRLIDVVREVVPMVPFSCEEGYCGSCETAVLDGIPDHRDAVLSDAERTAGTSMMICVGRSQTPQLVLDL